MTDTVRKKLEDEAADAIQRLLAYMPTAGGVRLMLPDGRSVQVGQWPDNPSEVIVARGETGNGSPRYSLDAAATDSCKATVETFAPTGRFCSRCRATLPNGQHCGGVTCPLRVSHEM